MEEETVIRRVPDHGYPNPLPKHERILLQDERLCFYYNETDRTLLSSSEYLYNNGEEMFVADGEDPQRVYCLKEFYHRLLAFSEHRIQQRFMEQRNIGYNTQEKRLQILEKYIQQRRKSDAFGDHNVEQERTAVMIPCFNETREECFPTIKSILRSRWRQSSDVRVYLIVDGVLERTVGTLKALLELLNFLPGDMTKEEYTNYCRNQENKVSVKEWKDYFEFKKYLPLRKAYISIVAKKKNGGKRDSQVLFMQKSVIDDEKVPRVALMADMNTSWKPKAFLMLQNTVLSDSNIACASGEVSVRYNNSFNPLIWAQIFEYTHSHILGKCFENLFDFVTCIPGAFCAYSFSALVEVFDRYAEVAVGVHDRNKLDLGEDRYLTFLLLSRGYRSVYVDQAISHTDGVTEIATFISQRRRWSNSTFINVLMLLRQAFMEGMSVNSEFFSDRALKIMKEAGKPSSQGGQLLERSTSSVGTEEDEYLYWLDSQPESRMSCCTHLTRFMYVGLMLSLEFIGSLLVPGNTAVVFFLILKAFEQEIIVAMFPMLAWMMIAIAVGSKYKINEAKKFWTVSAMIWMFCIGGITVLFIIVVFEGRLDVSTSTKWSLYSWIAMYAFLGVLNGRVLWLPCIIAYYLSIPLYTIIIPVASILNYDDFSWGNRQADEHVINLKEEDPEEKKKRLQIMVDSKNASMYVTTLYIVVNTIWFYIIARIPVGYIQYIFLVIVGVTIVPRAIGALFYRLQKRNNCFGYKKLRNAGKKNNWDEEEMHFRVSKSRKKMKTNGTLSSPYVSMD